MEVTFDEFKPHISFSEFSLLNQCHWRHKLQYIDGMRPPAAPALYFGSLIHAILEKIIAKETYTNEQFEEEFKTLTIQFAQELALSENAMYRGKLNKDLDEGYVKSMLRGGTALLDVLRDFNWSNYETIDTEIEVYEDLIEGKKFKGYIDWVYKKDGIYYIADFKTSKNKWGKWQRTDSNKRKQLYFYKYFFAKTNNIPLDKIKIQFIVLSWNIAPKNCIEFVDISSSDRHVKSSIAKLTTAAKTLLAKKRMILKNRASCRFCPFEHTTHCPSGW
tara:strand:+ start:1353 stop:2177 length:825 start_codon:yes stop_codon:yes gene_type:complete